VHLDRDARRDLHDLRRRARDELGEHRAIFEEPEDVAEHGARLAAIGGDDRERPTLTGGENATLVAEAREVDRHQCSHAAFAASATDDHPMPPVPVHQGGAWRPVCVR
jgi:hypothetical protein